MMTTPNLVTIDLDAPRNAAGMQGSVEAVTDRVLTALDGSKTPATFFVPRAVAESSPALVRKISEAGHEVACLTTISPATSRPYCATFSDELHATKVAIEDANGIRVRGHRTTGFAVDSSSEWAYDVLVDGGFEYDSSRFPLKYAEPGSPPMPKTVHAVRRWGGTLLEIPVSTTDVFAMRMQVGTTGTMRGLPLAVLAAVVEARQLRGESLVMHLTARELGARRAFSKAADRRTLGRVTGIVERFRFTSVANALPELLRTAPIIES